jgi:hypothetical protein
VGQEEKNMVGNHDGLVILMVLAFLLVMYGIAEVLNRLEGKPVTWKDVDRDKSSPILDNADNTK